MCSVLHLAYNSKYVNRKEETNSSSNRHKTATLLCGQKSLNACLFANWRLNCSFLNSFCLHFFCPYWSCGAHQHSSRKGYSKKGFFFVFFGFVSRSGWAFSVCSNLNCSHLPLVSILWNSATSRMRCGLENQILKSCVCVCVCMETCICYAWLLTSPRQSHPEYEYENQWSKIVLLVTIFSIR